MVMEYPLPGCIGMRQPSCWLRKGVSAPVATDYGFHLFQVVERLPAGTVPMSAVAAEIRETLRRERTEQRLAELVGEARRRYNVRVFGRNLPFNYQGLYSDGSPASQG